MHSYVTSGQQRASCILFGRELGFSHSPSLCLGAWMLPDAFGAAESALQAQSDAEIHPWGPQSPRETCRSRQFRNNGGLCDSSHLYFFSPEQRQAREVFSCPSHKRGNQGAETVNDLPQVLLFVEGSGLYEPCQAFSPGSYGRTDPSVASCSGFAGDRGPGEADCQGVPTSLLEGQQRRRGGGRSPP